MTDSTHPQAGVAAVITVNDMYHELQGLRSDIQTISGKFDDVPRQIADHEAQLRPLAGIPADIADHESRLRMVEKRIWMASGIAGLVSSGAVALVFELSRRH
jgi:hypothetical protein